MNNEFDFDKIGKRMPYTVPDGFFAQMEQNVMQELELKADSKPKSRRSRMRIGIGAITAIAASLMLLLIVNKRYQAEDEVSINDVEMAFSNLSTEDQNYLVSVYQEDVFMNVEPQNI